VNIKMAIRLNVISLALSLFILPSSPSFTGFPLISSSTDPCARASSTKTKEVDAQVAYDCLKSIPLNSSIAIALVDSLKPYLEFQTTLITLENPPPDYVAHVQPPLSIRGALSRVKKRIENGDYKGEYEVRRSPTASSFHALPRDMLHY
jgi:hypothetical protein